MVETDADYLARLRRDAEFGDSATLQAAAIAYGRDVAVVMAHGVDVLEVEAMGVPQPQQAAPPMVVVLAGEHYRSVRHTTQLAVGAAQQLISADVVTAIDAQLQASMAAERAEVPRATNGSVSASSDNPQSLSLEDLSEDDIQVLWSVTTELIDIVRQDTSTCTAWKQVFKGEAVFDTAQQAVEVLFDLTFSHATPVLALLLRAAKGMLFPSSATHTHSR